MWSAFVVKKVHKPQLDSPYTWMISGAGPLNFMASAPQSAQVLKHVR